MSRVIAVTTSIAKTAVFIVLVLWALLCLFPFYWLAVTSIKIPIDVSEGPLYLPFLDFRPTWHVWSDVIARFPGEALRPFVITIAVAAGSTAITMAVGVPAAYALTRFRYSVPLAAVILAVGACVTIAFANIDVLVAGVSTVVAVIGSAIALLYRRRTRIGSRGILLGTVASRVLPPVAIVLPLYIVCQRLGLLDTLAALILIYAAINLPIGIWLTHSVFAAISLDLDDAAMIEGASRARILLSIMVPLAKPALTTIALFIASLSWNEYLVAAFLTSDRAQTLPVYLTGQMAVREQLAASEPQWGYFSAMILVTVAPLVVLAAVLLGRDRAKVLAAAVR